jgi:hypothetical protein
MILLFLFYILNKIKFYLYGNCKQFQYYYYFCKKAEITHYFIIFIYLFLLLLLKVKYMKEEYFKWYSPNLNREIEMLVLDILDTL